MILHFSTKRFLVDANAHEYPLIVIISRLKVLYIFLFPLGSFGNKTCIIHVHLWTFVFPQSVKMLNANVHELSINFSIRSSCFVLKTSNVDKFSTIMLSFCLRIVYICPQIINNWSNPLVVTVCTIPST